MANGSTITACFIIALLVVLVAANAWNTVQLVTISKLLDPTSDMTQDPSTPALLSGLNSMLPPSGNPPSNQFGPPPGSPAPPFGPPPFGPPPGSQNPFGPPGPESFGYPPNMEQFMPPPPYGSGPQMGMSAREGFNAMF